MDKRINAWGLEQELFELTKTSSRELAHERIAHIEIKELRTVFAHLVVQADLEKVDVVRPVALGRGSVKHPGRGTEWPGP